MEGIDADAGRHYALAERGVFVDALVRILSDRRAATAMASAARELATTYYDWRDIGRRAAAVVVELCEIANQ
jgi:glycosyltransferase involved in cell wall biosynthesis